VALSAAAAMWGAGYVVTLVTLRFIPPIPLMEIRLLLVILAFLPIYLRERRKAPRAEARDFLLAAVSGTLGLGLSLVTQFYGTAWTSAHLASLLTATTPAFVALMALPLLGERLRWPQVVASALALLGAVVVTGPGGGGASAAGVAMLTLSAVTWAFGTVLNRRMVRRQTVVFVTFWTSVFAFLAALPVSGAALRLPYAQFSPAVWAGAAYGLLGMGLALYLWNYGFTQLPAATAGLFFFVQPLVGIVLGVCVLAEHLTFWLFPGGALIAIGLVLALRTQPAGGEEDSGAAGRRGQSVVGRTYS